jgi:tetratricopeptide (TPR) repeat protein
MAAFKDLFRDGRQLQAAKNFEPAIEKFREASEVEEKTSTALQAMAQCYTELGRHQEAIDAAKKAVEKEPDDQFSYISLSRAYQRGGFIPEAEYAMAQGQQAAWRAKQTS